MDSSNPPTGGEPVVVDTPDWRAQFPPDYRLRILNKIMETLKRQLPFSGQEGLQELNIIAVRFEEKIYSAATSQLDYLRKISLKMLEMEEFQKTIPDTLHSNSPNRSNQLSDPASLDSTSQIRQAAGGDWQEEVYQNGHVTSVSHFLMEIKRVLEIQS